MRTSRPVAVARAWAAGAWAAALSIAAVILPFALASVPGSPLRHAASAADRVCADSLAARMSIEDRAGQTMMLSIGSSREGSLSPGAASVLGEIRPGAILLFGFNVPDEAWRLSGLNASIRAALAGKGAPPPLVALDHEGGTVFRFRSGVTRLPSALAMGAIGPGAVAEYARAAGYELRALGVSLALAPVVELESQVNRDFLATRSFGDDPGRVDKAVKAFTRGIQARGVAATAKHFPGNGDVDPHLGLPVLGMDRAAYERDVLPRFRAAIGSGVSAVMLSHAMLPSVDGERSATFSPTLIRGHLKGRLGFGGIVLTDDLHMAALSRQASAGEAAVRALAAGADMVMLSSSSEAAGTSSAIAGAVRSGILREGRLSDAAARVLTVKIAMGLMTRQGAPISQKTTTEKELSEIVERGAERIGRIVRPR